MSNLQCPVDADLMGAVERGELTPEAAAMYTACRHVVHMKQDMDELKKKLDQPIVRPTSPIQLRPIQQPRQ